MYFIYCQETIQEQKQTSGHIITNFLISILNDENSIFFLLKIFFSYNILWLWFPLAPPRSSLLSPLPKSTSSLVLSLKWQSKIFFYHYVIPPMFVMSSYRPYTKMPWMLQPLNSSMWYLCMAYCNNNKHKTKTAPVWGSNRNQMWCSSC